MRAPQSGWKSSQKIDFVMLVDISYILFTEYRCNWARSEIEMVLFGIESPSGPRREYSMDLNDHRTRRDTLTSQSKPNLTPHRLIQISYVSN